jgi:hypothetical protein
MVRGTRSHTKLSYDIDGYYIGPDIMVHPLDKAFHDYNADHLAQVS